MASRKTPSSVLHCPEILLTSWVSIVISVLRLIVFFIEKFLLAVSESSARIARASETDL